MLTNFEEIHLTIHYIRVEMQLFTVQKGSKVIRINLKAFFETTAGYFLLTRSRTLSD